MKNKQRNVLATLFFTAILPITSSFAEESSFTTTPVNNNDDAQTSMQDIAQYLYNLGGDLGYDLKTAVTTSSSTLLISPPKLIQSMSTATFFAMVGAIPVNASPQDGSLLNFVPSNNATYTLLNTLANNTFLSYSSAGSITPAGANATPTPVTVSPLIDQQAYQSDPVSQFVLNLLGTPNSTFCMDSTQTTWVGDSQKVGDCPYLYNNKILSNIVGTIPSTPFLFPNSQDPIINELNSNTLLSPLLYTTVSTSPSPKSSDNPGLTATSQAQQAANFIRYVTGAVIPIPTISQANYNNLLIAIKSPNSSRTTKEASLAIVDTYLSGMRVHAAKASVAASNLYYILSKRLPQVQSQTDTSVNGTSQALTEMSMATRRLYDPAAVATGKPQWLTQIDTASPATVQKEMAILLSEINYQLYLNRQQEERILLTNSLLLIESLKQNRPEVPSAEEIQRANSSATTSTDTDTN